MLGKALARTENLVVQESGNELLIYDLENNNAFCLNETSALVWQLCDGKHSVTEIRDALSRRLETSIDEDLVWLALDQLNRDGLLQDGEVVASHFTGISRREIVRKIGFASMVALPIVSSIVAPKATMAQSGFMLCVPCTAPGDCASGFCSPFTTVCAPPGSFGSLPGTAFGAAPGACPAGALTTCCSGTAIEIIPSICECS